MTAKASAGLGERPKPVFAADSGGGLKKWGGKCVMLGLLGIAASSPLSAAGENHRESLRGLTGLAVRVERLSEEARGGGLSEPAIQAEAEQRLRKAGLRVLTPSEAAQEAGRPVLYIRVNARLPYGAADYSVNTAVALLQDATAARDPSLRLREAKTWDAGYLRTLPRPALGKVLDIVRDLLDEFIRDWREANGRQ